MSLRDELYDFYVEAKEAALAKQKKVKTEKEKAYYERIANYMDQRLKVQGGKEQ